MKTTLIYTILITLLFSTTLFCRISGRWKQVFPEENGEIPGPRASQYMCSIGDQQVVMIGGSGGGYPHNYDNETWLYDYNANTWTRLQCDYEMDTYFSRAWPFEFLCQISKTRVIWSMGDAYMFDLDSLKWFAINDTFKLSWTGTFLEENLIFGYTSDRPYHRCCGLSELIRLNPDEPFDSPDFLTREVINDEEITKQGPNYNYNRIVNSSSNEKYFAYYKNENENENEKITWIPAGIIGGEPLPQFMNAERDIWNWLFLEQGQDTIPYVSKRKYSKLTDNATLMHYQGAIPYEPARSDFYTIEYTPESEQINTYKIVSPGNGVYNCKMAQIKDGVVMLFGGVLPDGSLSNQTWIFEIDKPGVVDNTGDSVKIYTLDNNLYMLDDELKDAILYNILGQEVVVCNSGRLDLNPLPIGMYFLQYNENKIAKVAKIVKR